MIKMVKSRIILSRLFAKADFTGDCLYVVAEEVDEYGKHVHVLYVFDRDLNMLGRSVVSNADIDARLIIGRMISDAESIYFAGVTCVDDDDYQ
ncbi:MAG: hypothetical protein ACUVQ0_04765 [Thermoproteota archaeon]